MCEIYDPEKFCCVCERPIEAGFIYCKPCSEYLMNESKLEDSMRLWEEANPQEKFDTIHDDPYIMEPEELGMEEI